MHVQPQVRVFRFLTFVSIYPLTLSSTNLNFEHLKQTSLLWHLAKNHTPNPHPSSFKVLFLPLYLFIVIIIEWFEQSSIIPVFYRLIQLRGKFGGISWCERKSLEQKLNVLCPVFFACFCSLPSVVVQSTSILLLALWLSTYFDSQSTDCHHG